MHAWCQTPPPPRHVRMQAGRHDVLVRGRQDTSDQSRSWASLSLAASLLPCMGDRHASAPARLLLVDSVGDGTQKEKGASGDKRDTMRCASDPFPKRTEPGRSRTSCCWLLPCQLPCQCQEYESGDGRSFLAFPSIHSPRHPASLSFGGIHNIPAESDVYASVESPCNEMQEGKAYAWVGPAATGDTPLSLPLPILLHQAITLRFHQQ
jgi:hypothetical protein